MLLAECAAARVDLRTGHSVTEITRNDRFRIETNRGSFAAPALVLATGGLSIPKMGATGFAYEMARRFGLAVIEPRPGLVPLKVAGETLELCKTLAGVSADAIVSCGRDSFRENILFTHRGLSGPAILQISSYWREGDTLSLNLAPSLEIEDLLAERKRTRPKAELKTVLAEVIPTRLAHALAGASPANVAIANVPDRDSAATGAATEAMAGQTDRLRGLGESRGDGRRNRYRRAVFQDDGGARRAGLVCDRRGGRRHRMAGRLQFPVGVVERMVRGTGSLSFALLFEHAFGDEF